MATRANVAKTTHKMPVLVTCYRCKKSVDEKKTALCSICKNRMEPDCDGYPLQTYRLKSQESKTKWRCSKCTKKTVPKNVPSPDDNISNNVTVRKKPAYSINHLHTDIYKNKRKLLSPNQDSHILSDYDTSCETDTNTPKRLLTDSLDGSSTIKSPILYYEMQDTIAQLTTKLECAENALECKTLQNNELNKQVEELTKEIKLLKSICNSSTIIESSPIVNNKNNRQSFTSQDIFSTPTSGRLPLDVEDPTETTYRHLHKTIATLQKELTCAEQEIKTLNAQIQVLEQSLKNKQEQQQLTIKTKKPIQASLYDATCKNTIRVFGAQQCVGLAAALTRSRETTSLLSKQELLEITLQELQEKHNDPDVICLSETFVKMGHEGYVKIFNYVMAANYCREKAEVGLVY
ncbi:hypothetical protein HF086_006132 [Spodoptera exigua]|uniref:Uncharacterized protein n=1 Tax=Spodoptera exigua TaxID=7107 RepID=A0A922MW15_SPOEX|nr:hypothetical protein HF086_006132 [Spodoptera exigua]